MSYVAMTGLLLSFALPPLAQMPVHGGKPTAPAAMREATPRAPIGAPAHNLPQSAQTPSATSASVPGSAPPSATASGEPGRTEAGAAQPVKEEWPAEDIARAREQCMHVLSSTSADIEWMEPVKKGTCGLPAPIRLKSIGSEPKIVFDPPVQVNCRMVTALGTWAKSSLQPEAKQRFSSQVVRIVGASGYSCRNIYNLPNARLSQHALANAIDIGGFGLANGRVVGVLRGWGLTERDIKAQAKAKAAAVAKAKAERAKGGGKDVEAADAKLASLKGDDTRDGKPPASDKAAVSAKAGLAEKAKKNLTRASLTAASNGTSKAPIAADSTTETGPAKSTKEALFLRAIHNGACGSFGTVLGPEANDPHRNHFHLDLIQRRSSGYCE
jgi:hypothetical protein